MFKSIMNKLLEYPRFLAYGVVPTIIALPLTVWTYLSAESQVAVRPKLKEVGGMDALLSGHFSDWLIYHYTTYGTAIYFLFIFGVIAGAMWIQLKVRS